MLDLFPSRQAGPLRRRLRRGRGARIPVPVLTGLLGAGKPTLIRRFLASPQGQGTAVIVNEFGAIGIDVALRVVDADRSEFIDDHRRALPLRRREKAADQGGLAGAEQAGQDGDWNARAAPAPEPPP